MMKRVVLQEGKEKSLSRYHPWLFSGAISRLEQDTRDGDVVEVWDAKGHYLGTGHFHDNSISVRIFSFEKVVPDFDFWKSKILAAYRYRQQIGLVANQNTTMYRLVNGEGDGLPGLIIDWFDGHVVIQFHSYGMFLLKEQLVDILNDLFGDKIKSIYNKSTTTLAKFGEKDTRDELLHGNIDELVEVKENGNAFYIDILKGQKTGFFIDQRDNREWVGKFAGGKKVLNLFSYTGGFSVYALSAHAELVHSVDISKRTVEILDRNVKLSGVNACNHQSFIEDAFDYLDQMPSNYYDLIILDPPAFAKHHKVKEQGLKGYRNINRKAIEKITSGGMLFTFSCSQAVSKEDFQTLVFSSAIMEKREAKIVKQLQQAIDHPVSIYHPEGNYLKGMMLFIQ